MIFCRIVGDTSNCVKIGSRLVLPHMDRHKRTIIGARIKPSIFHGIQGDIPKIASKPFYCTCIKYAGAPLGFLTLFVRLCKGPFQVTLRVWVCARAHLFISVDVYCCIAPSIPNQPVLHCRRSWRMKMMDVWSDVISLNLMSSEPCFASVTFVVIDDKQRLFSTQGSVFSTITS